MEADKYAGDFRHQFGCHRPLIPLSPTLPVTLDIASKTIHRNFKQSIREATHGPHLLEAMQLRYNWQEGVTESIDWDAHRQATHAQMGLRTHYVKLCHDILPTGCLVCKYGQSLPDYCSLCRYPQVDFHHILRCHHLSRSLWRADLLATLTTKCHSLKTDPTSTNILLGGLRSWLDDTPFLPGNFPPDYHALIEEQASIGWAHFFQGRITTKWAETQQWYYNGFPKVRGQDGHSWSRKF